MSRNFNTRTDGRSFDEQTKIMVWGKAQYAPGFDPDIWKLDTCGALIKYSEYGLTEPNGNGWEIDHIIPVAHQGTDSLGNLQALQWQNNRNKSDRLDPNYCKISRK